MAKGKKVASSAAVNPTDKLGQLTTASEIEADANLGYKIRGLIYHLRNISKDEGSQSRTLQTTDKLYISSLYFTAKEASMIKGAICVLEEGSEPSEAPESVETTIKKTMANFFEQRKASGDARPCGTHDLAPIYEPVFGIGKEEVQEEKFLSRLRRQGLPAVEDEPKPAVTAGPVGGKKKDKGK
ncbi:uncharacterized protein PG986_003499 [Apiospora aurea]|uniref:Uncharacterized protein n=1 Tax=Apiospora aurea TaxID=335848 RepID=A0ABR1QRW5_9PEZI